MFVQSSPAIAARGLPTAAEVSDSDTRRNSGLPQDTPGSADKTSPSERIVDKRRLTMVPAALLACDFTQEQQDKQYEQQQQQQHEEQGQPGFSLSTLKQVCACGRENLRDGGKGGCCGVVPHALAC